MEPQRFILRPGGDPQVMQSLLQAITQRNVEKEWEVVIQPFKKTRTNLQNRAMHKYFTLLSESLSGGGYDVMHTLKQDAEIPWTPELVKDLLWRPIMQAMTEKFSTTDLETHEVSQIYDVLNHHLGQKLGIHVPFPVDEDKAAPIK